MEGSLVRFDVVDMLVVVDLVDLLLVDKVVVDLVDFLHKQEVDCLCSCN